MTVINPLENKPVCNPPAGLACGGKPCMPGGRCAGNGAAHQAAMPYRPASLLSYSAATRSDCVTMPTNLPSSSTTGM